MESDVFDKEDIRTCLHRVTSCVFSDRISIGFVQTFPFSFGHIHVHFIHYQLISISETATGESAASALER